MLKYTQDFQTLSKQYTVFLFDIVGVVHTGIDACFYAIETINALPIDRKVIFLSNMPRPGSQSREKLLNLGISRPFDVLTSGDVARDLLQTTYKGKKIYHWGTERNKDIDSGLTLNLTEQIEECELVLLTAFLEENEDETGCDPLIDKIVQLKIPVLCANPDKIAIHGSTIRRCAGSIAEKIVNNGGKAIYIGKPDPLIYQTILSKLPSISPSEILMIGDTIETDVIGAKQTHIDSLLVLTGNTGNELRKNNLSLEDYLKVNEWEQYAPTFYSKYLIPSRIQIDNDIE